MGIVTLEDRSKTAESEVLNSLPNRTILIFLGKKRQNVQIDMSHGNSCN